jgi:hypothetical protein
MGKGSLSSSGFRDMRGNRAMLPIHDHSHSQMINEGPNANYPLSKFHINTTSFGVLCYSHNRNGFIASINEDEMLLEISSTDERGPI